LGYFDTISNKQIKRIAKWNGTSWDAFGTDLLFSINGSGLITACVFYKGEYYFGGNFELGNGYNEIMRWDGSQWKQLNNGVLGNAWINSMVVYKNFLFVGGFFQQSNGNSSDYIMAWDGQQWFNPFPDIYFMSQVKDLEVIDNKLFIVGDYVIPNDDGMYAFANYDGTNFCPFGGRAIYPDYPDPSIIAGLTGNIYVACNKVLFGDTVNYIAKYTGTLCDTSIYIPLSINSELDIKDNLTIFPNPFSNSSTIKLSQPLQNATLNIYNILGKEVRYLHNLNGTEIKISREGIQNGMYFFTLFDSEKLIGTGKMIVD
jgi:hypothetical protein